MSSSIDTPSLIAGIRALRMGYSGSSFRRDTKFNPYHKPAGSPGGTGGEFDVAPGGSGSRDSTRTGGGRFGIRKPSKNPLLHRVTDSDNDGVPDMRPRNPMDPAGGYASPGRGNSNGLTSAEAEIATERIRQFNRAKADDLHEMMVGRAYGRMSPKESNPQLRDAADDIERFLGGKIDPQDIKPSKSDDLVIQKGDKKFRMDIKNPGRMKDRKTLDEPHFHFEQWNDERKTWVDASNDHKNYFKKD